MPILKIQHKTSRQTITINYLLKVQKYQYKTSRKSNFKNSQKTLIVPQAKTNPHKYKRQQTTNQLNKSSHDLLQIIIYNKFN